MSEPEDGGTQLRVEHPDGRVEKHYGVHRKAVGHSAAAFLKHPTTGTAGIVAAVVAAVTFNPAILPYALADHNHVEEIAKITSNTVKEGILRVQIELAAAEIVNNNRRVSLKICVIDGCRYETSLLEDAKLKKETLEHELDRMKR